jgi:hypothetical protein
MHNTQQYKDKLHNTATCGSNTTVRILISNLGKHEYETHQIILSLETY